MKNTYKNQWCVPSINEEQNVLYNIDWPTSIQICIADGKACYFSGVKFLGCFRPHNPSLNSEPSKYLNNAVVDFGFETKAFHASPHTCVCFSRD